MCAECHSTGVRKNYDAANDRFATTWAEISVGCEACHGQGSRHVAWARDRAELVAVRQDRRSAQGACSFASTSGATSPGRIDPKTGNAAAQLRARDCCARRSRPAACATRAAAQFSEDWVPGRWLSDTHVVSPLARGLYHADGQMLDEVYNYGSFKQSKMFAAGVTCSDCHEPHSAKLRAAGDGVCLQCHVVRQVRGRRAPPPCRRASPPLACASCHMPARTYMVVDRRHDHSFRIPRPDLSAQARHAQCLQRLPRRQDRRNGRPSAIERWHGPQPQRLSELCRGFPCGVDRRSRCRPRCSARSPPIAARRRFARASALTELGRARLAGKHRSGADRACPIPTRWCASARSTCSKACPPRSSGRWSRRCSPIPVAACASGPPSLLAAVPTAQPACRRSRALRARGGRVRRGAAPQCRPAGGARRRSEISTRGAAATAEAEAEYKAALRLSPQYRAGGDQPRRSLSATRAGWRGRERAARRDRCSPRDAGLHHALGLALVRLKRHRRGAGANCAAQPSSSPDRARYAYVYAVALHSAGRGEQAMAVLKENLARHPEDRDTLLALISFSRDAGDLVAALEYAERLARLVPGDRDVANLVRSLQSQLQKPDGK